MIHPCKCSHEYQDAKYGKGNRVFNDLKKQPKMARKFRCTVCGNLIQKGASEDES